MVGGERQYTLPMNIHGKKLADYAIERINEGLKEVEEMTVEHSLGKAVMSGVMTAEEAMACLEAYESTFMPPAA